MTLPRHRHRRQVELWCAILIFLGSAIATIVVLVGTFLLHRWLYG